ncbi:MAG: 3-phosphoserine/phosphohydroxythreonine transaminase [Desulfuromonas sp.]|nr:3-phosphoserine/phosphohydroxythreonine transaminase [Desulfuromonas sp.]
MRRREQTFNFSGGPAVMPESVLIRAQSELLNWHNSGMSVLEMPFTGSHFMGIMASAKQKIRQILSVPDNYHVLFMQGGASTQFALVPMNLLSAHGQAVYIDSGYWSRKAATDAAAFGRVHIGASNQDRQPLSMPEASTWSIPDNADYCHITSNETAQGVALHTDPQLASTALIADMTSDFMSRPIRIENYAMLYAGTQKNIGPTGLVILIIRDDLLEKMRPETPRMLSYKQHIINNNRLNTPLTYSIYLTDLVCDWIIQQGGVSALLARNQQRAQRLYNIIDQDSFYTCAVDPLHRSIMNICFHLPTPQLKQHFIATAEQQGLLHLQGHQQFGGIRASLYNAQTDQTLQALGHFMQQFRTTYSRCHEQP